jgi:chromosome segregation protein
MVQKQSKDTQFIVVSHRKPMIESANRTIGVTQKEKGITKVTGVKLRD